MKAIDLKESELCQVVELLASYPEIEKALVFGSRALGNAKPGSDIDIALIGIKITPEIVAKVKGFLEEETLLPYFFDIVHFETIENEQLKRHIHEFGKVFYCAEENRI